MCCAAGSRAELLEAARRGYQGGIQPFTLSNGECFPAGHIPDAALRPTNDPSDMRILRIAAAALRQIQDDLHTAINRYGAERIAVCAGSSDNGTDRYAPALKTYFTTGAFPLDYDPRVQAASYPPDFIRRSAGVSGPAFTVSTACASSAGAIVQAAELIRAGFCDAAIAGGVDIASETVLRGFNSLEAISKTVCNPFSKNRSGITIGDGAAFFVMSREDISGAGISLLGSGENADAYHMTAPHPDGLGAVKAMEKALAEAGIRPEDTAYINLHGTGTLLNDSMEAKAIRSVFGSESPPASSTKPITGHTLGAAGALELALCWEIIASAERETALPVHCWDGVRDEDFPPLNLVRKEDIVKNPHICMSNSFGFGGCNVSLILGKRD
jgi:3-oxoacyl-[acyl-carrier-protein] synthase-1